MARNYYIILGIEPDATQEQIKSAYRSKAKQSHPDHHGGGSKPFRDVQEAYEILSDPACRRAYDDELAREVRPPTQPRSGRAEPTRARRCPVEPLIPTERSIGLDRGSPGSSDRWFGSMLGSLWGDLDSLAWPERRATQALQVSVPLTRQQAAYGGRVRIRIPLQQACPRCQGYGWLGFDACWACGGTGTTVTHYPVSIEFPAGISDGTVATVSLDRLGVPDVALAVRFDVRW